MARQTARQNTVYALGLAALLSMFWFVDAHAACTPLGSVTGQLGLCKPAAGESGWTDAINRNWDLIDANVGTIPTGTILLYGGNSPPTGWYVCDGSAKNRTTDAGLFTVFGVTYGNGDGSTTFNLPFASSRVPVFAGSGTYTTSTDFSNVNAGTDNITIPTNNSFYTGTQLVFTTTGTPPGGLSNGNTYYALRVDATTIQLATSQANAVAGTQINITSQGTGTHSFTISYSTRNLADLGGEETHADTIAEMPAHNHGLHQATGGAGGNENVSISSTGTTQIGDNTTAMSTKGSSTGHNILNPFIAFTCIVKR